jgi:hypothetical protein
MLRYLAQAKRGQVIVTSATPLADIQLGLAGADVTVVDLGEDRLLQPQAGTGPLD